MNRTATSHFRLVDRYAVHGGRAPLVRRVGELVPEDTDFVVLDLDRTVHLGVTIGECLGWEILGDPRCELGTTGESGALDPYFSVRRPLKSLAGLTRGVHHWGLAGLYYAGTVRLGDRWTAWDAFLTRTLGPDYVDEVQSVLRNVLMASTAGYTREQLRGYAERAWLRWSRRLVVDAEVVEAIRKRCPNLQAIVLSSASTAPTVEHAARKLGIDGFVSSAVDVYPVDDDEVFSAPVDIPAWLRRGRPRFFSRPGAVVHNSAENKVSFLRMHYPEIFAPGAVTVGITDNNYGEDRTWPDHFDHVVALNSRHPFSPFVRAMSPCKTIQIVDATPVAENGDRERGFDWHGTLKAGVLDGDQLGRRFSEGEHSRLEALVDQLRSARERVAAGADGSLRRSVAAVGARLVETVERYNRAPSKQKPTIARELHGMAASMRRVQGKLEKMRRSCARIYHELELLHDRVARAVACRQN